MTERIISPIDHEERIACAKTLADKLHTAVGDVVVKDMNLLIPALDALYSTYVHWLSFSLLTSDDMEMIDHLAEIKSQLQGSVFDRVADLKKKLNLTPRGNA